MTRKTRKNRSSNNDRTIHSIHHWFQHCFTQLGWMVLAKSHGYYDKINCYKNSVNRLCEAIEHKIHTVHEIDRKNDLRIMLKDVECLKRHIAKDF